ncbi:hypothetical protein [Pseudoalteromonas sp. T1lg24]|uniref:hypothetical protein n=1 Tax=Pseudoalteromonas sp. T1lg24 TaxID=2077099 RepID=UPI000CF63190|nr:hypothetical protein [Pseudoalteromonas sp. T1lg24]
MNMDLDFDIHPQFEAFYIESMLWHTNSALDAAKVVGEWIELVVANDEKALELPKDKLFEQLQLIIQHAASLSKYLWPIRGGVNSSHQKRGRKIRSALYTDDSSSLKCRKLRDGMEHFDEKLDKYLEKNQVGEFLPSDVRAEVPVSEVPLHIFKGFYINPRVFVLLGNEYELLPIVAEVVRIHDLLMGFVNSGYRFPYE